MSELRKSILVVEDDPLIAMDLAALLEENGWRVVGPAGTEKRARALITDEDLSVALLDINLGSGNSYEIADLLAAKGVPIVFLTGDLRHARSATHENSCTLAKPVDFRELQRALYDSIAHS